MQRQSQRTGQWPQARAAISALDRVPRVGVAAAPTVAAFILATWHTVPDNYGWYGVSEAGHLLAKLEAELRRQAIKGLAGCFRPAQ